MKPKYDLHKREEPKGLNEWAIEFILNHPALVFTTIFIILAMVFALVFNCLWFVSCSEHYYNFAGV